MKQNTRVTALPNGPGLEPYEGPWEKEQAAHLLRRATFGPTFSQIKEATALGLEGTLDKLFSDQPMPERQPINYYYEKDPLVPVGDTWLDKPYTKSGSNTRFYRKVSLTAWTLQLLLEEGISLREKMVLFWHNHFVTEMKIVNDPRVIYQYISLFREDPWGSFQELVRKVTINPAMLRYLNGNQNTGKAPNENYARELLELFTIGKGPFAGPGDYTNYTEQDVLEIAKALTGWRDRGFYTSEPDEKIESYYVSARHDKTVKQLSHRFGNAIIQNAHGQEYRRVIDIIFQQEEVARFICRKLYRWFIYYKIDEEVEERVIEPMAQLLRENDYQMEQALKALFRSSHFFASRARGPMIRNPLDFLVSSLKQLEIEFPDDLYAYYGMCRKLFIQLPKWEMEYYNPPNVAGWKAYHQEPTFYRNWISSATLPNRQNIFQLLVGGGFRQGGNIIRVDPLKLLSSLDNPDEPNAMIAELALLLLPRPLTEEQIGQLKEALIPGLPDYEWTVEYGQYLAGDESIKKPLENKLFRLLNALLSLPEFQLS